MGAGSSASDKPPEIVLTTVEAISIKPEKDFDEIGSVSQARRISSSLSQSQRSERHSSRSGSLSSDTRRISRMSMLFEDDMMAPPPPHLVKPYKWNDAHMRILAHVMTRPEPKVEMIQTYWKDKRNLLPDQGLNQSLDTYAEQTPDQFRNHPKRLLNYFDKKATSQAERGRLIYRWLCKAVRYDAQGSDDVQVAMVKGKASARGFANISQMMCCKAGLDCEMIAGLAKMHPLMKGEGREFDTCKEHWWNRVKFDGKWYLWDASGGADDALDTDEIQDHFDDAFFMPHPDGFKWCRLPMTAEGSISLELQLTPSALSDLEMFRDSPICSPAVAGYKATCQSHTSRTISTYDTNELCLTFNSPFYLNWHSELIAIDGTIIKGHSMVHYQDGKIHVCVRLPHSGDFHLVVSVQPAGFLDTDLLHTQSVLYTYLISSECNQKLPSFPLCCPVYGPPPEFLCTPFTITDYEGPFVEAPQGKVTLTIDLGCQAWIFCHIAYFFNDSPLKGCVYTERRKKLALFYVRCPFIGEYCLRLSFSKTEEYERIEDHMYINFIISCKEKDVSHRGLPSHRTLYGPHVLNMRKHQIHLLSPLTSSTLTIEGGDTQVVLYISDRNTKVHPLLLDAHGKETPLSSQILFMEMKHEVLVFHMRMDNTGLLKLLLYTTDDRTKEELAVFAIHCITPTLGGLFPLSDVPAGISQKFKDMGFFMKYQDSYIKTRDGQAIITICMPEWYAVQARLCSTSDDTCDHELERNCLAYGTLTRVNILCEPPAVGLYRIEARIGIQNEDRKPHWERLGFFLVHCGSTAENPEDFEEFTQQAGCYKSFYKLGFEEMTLDTSLVEAPRGFCRIQHSVPQFMEVTVHVMKEGAVITGVYTKEQADDGTMTFTFRLPENGYYSFTGMCRSQLIFTHILHVTGMNKRDR